MPASNRTPSAACDRGAEKRFRNTPPNQAVEGAYRSRTGGKLRNDAPLVVGRAESRAREPEAVSTARETGR